MMLCVKSTESMLTGNHQTVLIAPLTD